MTPGCPVCHLVPVRLLALLLLVAVCHGAPLDDAPWAAYFGSQYALYVAMRAPHALDAAEARFVAGLKPDEPLARALKEKVLARPLDLVERGGAVGVTSNDGVTRILLVAERTPAADRLIAWARKTYPLKTVKVGTRAALEVGAGAARMFVLVEGSVVLVADHPEDLEQAFKTRTIRMLDLPGSRVYSRLRPLLRPDASAIAIVQSGPELAGLLKHDGTLSQLAEVAGGTVDGYGVALSGDARAPVVDLFLGLNDGSAAYEKLHLAERAKFYASHSLALGSVAPGDAQGFVSALQPPLDAASQKQWDVFKGQLQMQTGLSYDAEIAPWLGPESGVVLRAADEKPELALLLTTTDAKASRASLDKAVRHLTITQNCTFTRVTHGTVEAQVAAERPGNPVTPALAVAQGTVVLSTSPSLMKSVATFPLKAAQTGPHERLTRALDKRGTIMVGWLDDALAQRLARMTNSAPPPDWIKALGVGLAMPRADLVHVVVTLSTK